VDIASDNYLASPSRSTVKLTVGLIVMNFEGYPSDVHCYDNAVLRQVNDKNIPDQDLNRYDWLFSGWVDYWAWRARRAVPPRAVVLTDPDLVKALAWRESHIGNLSEDDKTKRGQTLLNMQYFFDVLAHPDNTQRIDYDLSWGLMNIQWADRTNPIMEIGATVRRLYASYYANTKGRTDSEAIWKDAFQDYGPHDAQEISCYGAQILETARIGKQFHGKKNNGCLFNGSSEVNPSASYYDVWGKNR
jgi:hypothetical protein